MCVLLRVRASRDPEVTQEVRARVCPADSQKSGGTRAKGQKRGKANPHHWSRKEATRAGMDSKARPQSPDPPARVGLPLRDSQATPGVPGPSAAWAAEGSRGRVAPAGCAPSRLGDPSYRLGTVHQQRGGRGRGPEGRARRKRRTLRTLPPPLSFVPIPARRPWPPDHLLRPPLRRPAPLSVRRSWTP